MKQNTVIPTCFSRKLTNNFCHTDSQTLKTTVETFYFLTETFKPIIERKKCTNESGLWSGNEKERSWSLKLVYVRGACEVIFVEEKKHYVYG